MSNRAARKGRSSITGKEVRLFEPTLRSAYERLTGSGENIAIAAVHGMSREAVRTLLKRPASQVQLKTVLKLLEPLADERDRREVFDAWVQDCISALQPITPSRDIVDRIESMTNLDNRPEWALAVARKSLQVETAWEGRFNLYARATTLSLRLDDAMSTVQMCEEIFDWGTREMNDDLKAMALAIRARALRYLGAPYKEVLHAQGEAASYLGIAELGTISKRLEGWTRERPAAYFANDMIESEHAHLVIKAVVTGGLKPAALNGVRKVVETRKRTAKGALGHVRYLTLEAMMHLALGEVDAARESVERAEALATDLGRLDVLCGPLRGQLLVAQADLEAGFRHYVRLAEQFREAKHLYLSRQMQLEVARLSPVARRRREQV